MKFRKFRAAYLAAGVAAMLGVGAMVAGQADAADPTINFTMVRSASAVNAGCLPYATAAVRVVSHGQTETMTIKASGLPANTEFDLFVTQLPNAPFGVSWYQSDLDTGYDGTASVTVIGRFNIETFAVAPASGPAPVVHGADASTNPPFAPIHTFHLGLWFNSPTDAVAAGCPGVVTPFNGDHTAGVQAMSTRNFPDLEGPLRQLAS